MHDPLHPLGGAVGVDAVGVALALEADERARRSSGSVVGNVHGSLSGRACAEHRADDLGDDVARLAHDDGVARAHVLQADLVLVVQAGELDGRAGDDDRAQLGERRRPPGAPDRDEDVLEQRRALLGRELVGDRPPGRVRGRAERPLEGEVVHLHDDPVDLVAEVVAVLLQVAAVREHRLEVRRRPWSPG